MYFIAYNLEDVTISFWILDQPYYLSFEAISSGMISSANAHDFVSKWSSRYISAIYVSFGTNIMASDNVLLPVLRQAIRWTNAGAFMQNDVTTPLRLLRGSLKDTFQ